MVSKAKVKYIKSLQIKKFRKVHGEFVVEGAKSVTELLHSDFQISSLYVTDEFQEKYTSLIKSAKSEVMVVKQQELEDLGTFASNNAALAVVKIKGNTPLFIEKEEEYVLVLDEVKDPGNLGTIIRIADWYGIKKIICSDDSAEVYNPKVISSTMGSFTRVSIYYCNLEKYFEKNREKVYAAMLDGNDVHKVNFAKRGFLLMGNESSGVHSSLYPFVSEKISIPRRGGAESLNVAVATAILCDNLYR